MRSLVLLGCLILPACASTEMRSYVGQDIREVILVNGPPVNALDMGNGVRAFQFMWGGASKTAVASHSSTQVSPGDAAQWLRRGAIETSSSTMISSGCVVSYLATWNDQRQSWVVNEYRYPKQLMC
jgi:hypothetical protein